MKLPFGFEITRKAAVGVTQVPAALSNGMLGFIRDTYPGAWQNGAPPVMPIGDITLFAAVYACVTRVASDIAKLQPVLLTDDPAGITVQVGRQSRFWSALRKPNDYQNRIQFLAAWMTTKLLWGNAYVYKRRESVRGMVRELIVLDPRRVTPMVSPDGSVYYSLGGDDLAQVPKGEIVPASEIIHDRHVTLWHPLVGVSPIVACAASASQGIRIQGNSSKFFENMSRPSGMLTAPGAISEATAQRLKSEWEANYAGLNIGRMAVLGDGLKYEAMTIPAESAQLMQQLAWTVEDVGRAFAVPLYKIGAGQMPTAGNVEALESQYYSGCLQIYIEALELCLTEGLEMPEAMHVEMNLDGLLRMDSSTQIDALTKAVGGTIMTPNEARKARNLPPIAGGDSVYLQQQNYSLEALARRDAQADPFGTAPAPSPAPATAADDQIEEDDEDISDEIEDDNSAVERLASELMLKFVA
jgi:HK97 family phage portal protein